MQCSRAAELALGTLRDKVQSFGLRFRGVAKSGKDLILDFSKFDVNHVVADLDEIRR